MSNTYKCYVFRNIPSRRKARPMGFQKSRGETAVFCGFCPPPGMVGYGGNAALTGNLYRHKQRHMDDLQPFWDRTDRINDGYVLPHEKAPALASSLVGNPMLPQWRQLAREKAVREKATEFIAPCPRHGEQSLADTETGACLLCLDQFRDMPARVQYQAAMGIAFMATCEVHGAAVHRFGAAGCSECRDARGRPLKQSKARALARKRGDQTYEAVCVTHGTAAHHVTNGKCSTCYTTAGLVRKSEGPGRPGDARRVAARAEGAATYLADCEKHGEVPHHTVRGKCLTCYNTLGQPRKKALTPDA